MKQLIFLPLTVPITVSCQKEFCALPDTDDFICDIASSKSAGILVVNSMSGQAR